VGLLTGSGLALLGLPFAILLGFTVGVLNLIPFVGFYISLVISLLTGFVTPEPFVAMLKIASVFLTVQALEAYVITPKIVGERVGLHPVAVIFSVLIFSRFLGFWGLIIGVPTAALIKFLINEWKRRHKWMEILARENGSEG
jgi:predicted PurR-regulated permease PerM